MTSCASLTQAPRAAHHRVFSASSTPARAASKRSSPCVHPRVLSRASVSTSYHSSRKGTRVVSTRADASSTPKGDSASASLDDASPAAVPAGRPVPDADELVLVVGGAGRVGTRLVTTLRSMGVATRVVTRDPSSAASAALRALGAEIVRGDVTDDDFDEIDAAVAGCTRVVACFGAQRISKPSDALFLFDETRGPNVFDKTHPAAVNHRGVARLAEACARSGTVRRFVRVTGMSAGYAPFDFVAVALNAVLSMTIRWQRLGEVATRALAEAEPRPVEYAVVRPGNLLDQPRPAGSVVVLGYGGARVPAGKVSRDDVAECVLSATFAANAANATVGVAGKRAPSGGVAAEMAWDPARGAHYKTVALADEVLEGEDVHAMMRSVRADQDTLEPQKYQPYVAFLFALVAGVAALMSVGVFRLAAKIVRCVLGAA